MESFIDLIFNPNVWVMFPHTVTSGFATAAFFVMGISAYHLMRKSSVDLYRRSFQIAAIFGFVAVLLVALNGHSQAQHMVRSQPMKMAAAEALWKTESPASFSLLTIGDLTQREEVFSIRLPRLLCLLAYDHLDCTIEGIHDLQAKYAAQYGPGDYIPPVAVIYWSFRLMVGAGTLMILLALYALFLVMGEIVTERPRALKLFLWAMVLPYVANTFGWLLTELGRAPWLVYGLLKLDAGLSTTVPAGQVLVSLIGYVLVYGGLMVATIYLLSKYARAGASELPVEPAIDSVPSLVGAQD
jgi:cytochrome d ubiquinol oxidase subunit I